MPTPEVGSHPAKAGSEGERFDFLAGLREQINPTILAIATALIVVSILFLVSIELLRRRTERLRSGG